MKKLFSEEHLDQYLEYFSIPKKKFQNNRIVLAALFFFVGVLLATQSTRAIILIPIFMFFGYKMPYFSLANKKKKSDILKNFAFPKFIDTFLTLLDTQGNVYNTLKATVPHIKDPLSSKLQKMVEDIETGEDRRQPYIEFAQYVGSPEAFTTMDKLYQFDTEGIRKESLNTLESHIRNLNENKTKEVIDKEIRKTERFGFPPLIFAVIFVLSFMGIQFYYYGTTMSNYLNY
jgi:Flp pilus assembly protein TadB